MNRYSCKKKLIVVVVALLCLFSVNGVSAALEVMYITDIFVDTPTISKGYTIISQDENFYVGIRPEVLAVETRVVIKQYDKEQFEFPEGWQIQVYE